MALTLAVFLLIGVVHNEVLLDDTQEDPKQDLHFKYPH